MSTEGSRAAAPCPVGAEGGQGGDSHGSSSEWLGGIAVSVDELFRSKISMLKELQ